MSQYVLNTWYPLTWSRNVGRALSAHQIVEQRVVLYRTEAGRAANRRVEVIVLSK